jgi:hypothetical protein
VAVDSVRRSDWVGKPLYTYFYVNWRAKVPKSLSGALGSTHFDVPATQKRAQRNQITRELVMSKFAIWIWCFCHIRV